jgi:hypothetical protein
MDLLLNLLTARIVGLAFITMLGLTSAFADNSSADRCTILRVAERYIAKAYPSFDGLALKPIIVDKKNTWEVTYELPENTLGGTPVVVIDKSTLNVVDAYSYQ